MADLGAWSTEQLVEKGLQNNWQQSEVLLVARLVVNTNVDVSIRADNVLPGFLLAQTVVRELLALVDATTAKSVQQMRQQCMAAVKDSLLVNEELEKRVYYEHSMRQAAEEKVAMLQMALVQPPGWALTLESLPILTKAATKIQARVRGRQARRAFVKWCGDVVRRAEALHEPILPPRREPRPTLPLHLQPLPGAAAQGRRERTPYRSPEADAADGGPAAGGPEADVFYGVQPRLARRLAVMSFERTRAREPRAQAPTVPAAGPAGGAGAREPAAAAPAAVAPAAVAPAAGTSSATTPPGQGAHGTTQAAGSRPAAAGVEVQQQPPAAAATAAAPSASGAAPGPSAASAPGAHAAAPAGAPPAGTAEKAAAGPPPSSEAGQAASGHTAQAGNPGAVSSGAAAPAAAAAAAAPSSSGAASAGPPPAAPAAHPEASAPAIAPSQPPHSAAGKGPAPQESAGGARRVRAPDKAAPGDPVPPQHAAGAGPAAAAGSTAAAPGAAQLAAPPPPAAGVAAGVDLASKDARGLVWRPASYEERAMLIAALRRCRELHGHFQDLEDHSRDQAQSLLAEIAALQSLNDALRHANANLAVLSDMRRQLDAERAARRELQRVMAAVQSDAVAAPDLSFLNNLREVPGEDANFGELLVPAKEPLAPLPGVAPAADAGGGGAGRPAASGDANPAEALRAAAPGGDAGFGLAAEFDEASKREKKGGTGAGAGATTLLPPLGGGGKGGVTTPPRSQGGKQGKKGGKR